MSLKAVYQKEAVQNHHIKEIFEVQTTQSHRFESPLVPFETFATYLAHQTTLSKVSPTEVNANAVALVATFMKEKQKLLVLKHLPEIVKFYQIIHSNLAFKVTIEQSQDLTVTEAIEKFDLEDIKNSEWIDFKVAWGSIFLYSMVYYKGGILIIIEIREAFKEVEGCQDQAMNRPFESEFAEIDDSTLLSRLLSHHADDENDEIYRAILLLVKTQGDVYKPFTSNTYQLLTQLIRFYCKGINIVDKLHKNYTLST